MPDVGSLLQPISDERPGGEDVFYGDDFAELTALRELRDKSEERKWTPDWDGVAEVAERILTEQSKDIRVALYLAEALLHTRGFEGFHFGLDLVLQMLQRFPEAAHPVDVDDRAYALDFLVGTLQADSRQMPEVIRAVELFPLTDWGHHFHDYRTWKNAKPAPEKGKGKGTGGEAEDAGNPTPANFGKGLVETSKAYYKGLDAAVPECIATLTALEKWGKDYFEGKVDPRDTPIPKYSRLTAELKNVKDAAADLLARKLVDDPDPVTESAPAVSSADAAAPVAEGAPAAGAVSAGGISPEPRDADDATGRVVTAARFLRRASPTDPGPYMMIRGLRWGELRSGGTLNRRLLEPPDTALRRKLTGLLVDESWEELLDVGEEVMGMTCGRGWLDLQRYIVTALDNLGAEYAPVSEAIRGQLSALLADVPGLLEHTMMDDMPTANAQTRAWLELTGLIADPAGDGAADADGDPDYDRERVLSEATHERALALAATGNARRGIEMLMKRADREESARARFITESLAASVMVDAGMIGVAKPMLEDLERLIEGRKLGEWESAEVVARPLGLLYRCLQPNDRKRAELYDKICRLDPVHAMTLEHQGQQASAEPRGQPFQSNQPASPTRGQPFQPNEPAKSPEPSEAVDSGSIDSSQGSA